MHKKCRICIYIQNLQNNIIPHRKLGALLLFVVITASRASNQIKNMLNVSIHLLIDIIPHQWKNAKLPSFPSSSRGWNEVFHRDIISYNYNCKYESWRGISNVRRCRSRCRWSNPWGLRAQHLMKTYQDFLIRLQSVAQEFFESHVRGNLLPSRSKKNGSTVPQLNTPGSYPASNQASKQAPYQAPPVLNPTCPKSYANAASRAKGNSAPIVTLKIYKP